MCFLCLVCCLMQEQIKQKNSMKNCMVYAKIKKRHFFAHEELYDFISTIFKVKPRFKVLQQKSCPLSTTLLMRGKVPREAHSLNTQS